MTTVPTKQRRWDTFVAGDGKGALAPGLDEIRTAFIVMNQNTMPAQKSGSIVKSERSAVTVAILTPRALART